MVRLLTDDDVAAVLELERALPVVEDALIASYEGAVERPERPHYPIGHASETDHSAGTALSMPAYVHGATYAATKLATVHEGNRDRELPTVQAQLSLVEADTGRPVGYLDATRITNVRTGCIGGIAVERLAADEPIDLTVVGAGTQARWQTRAIAAAVAASDDAPALRSVSIYSPSDSRRACATDLDADLDVPVEPVATPREAVSGASVVVTATTSEQPVFPGDALAPGTVVVAVGAYTPEMRELDDATVERAATVVADVPAEAAETGDLRTFPSIEPHQLGAVVAGDVGREAQSDVIVVASVGSAVLDAAVAEHVFDRARDRGLGTEVSL